MIFTMDVGNTNIKTALFEGREMRNYWRISTNTSYTSDEYGLILEGLFARAGLSLGDVEGIVMSSVFQALGEGLISLVMSALRQMVFLLPLAWALASFVGLEAVWYSLPIAEVVGFVLALVFYRHIYNHKIAHIETVKFD